MANQNQKDENSEIPDLKTSTNSGPKKPKKNKFAYFCAIIPAMASTLLGYDLGVMSGAAIFIKADFKLSDVKVEVLVGILSLYAIIGAAAAGRISDWIGRRYTMLFAGVLFFAGAILMSLAMNYAFLMFGRFVAGVGVGFAALIASVYTAEISPTSSRGCLNSFPDVFINFGILLGYVSNFVFSKLPTHLSWRFMLGIGAFPSVLLMALVSTMPESPRWLVMQGRLTEAKQILDKTSDSKHESHQRLAAIKDLIGIPSTCTNDVVQLPNHRSHGQDVWKELFLNPTRSVRHILIAVIGLHFFQQTSAIDALVLYSPKIFEKAGITSSNKRFLATIGLGLTKTLFILIATILLDRIGRRPLILVSVAGKAASLVILGFGLTMIENSPEKIPWAVRLCLVVVFSDVAFFSIGLGPMGFVYGAEIFPLRLRAQGVSVGMVVNRVTSAVVTMTFLSLCRAITIGGVFFLYAGITAVSWGFFYVVFPETRRRNLEDVDGLFGNLMWKFSVEKGSGESAKKGEIGV